MKNESLTDKELNNVTGGFEPKINDYKEQIHEDKGTTKTHPEPVRIIPEKPPTM